MSEFGRWAVIVHGGAKTIPADENHPNRSGCLHAVFAARARLAANQSAIDAVEAAVRALEDDPCFNAGFGSVLNAAGEVEADAAIMDGDSLAIGAVGAIQGVRASHIGGPVAALGDPDLAGWAGGSQLCGRARGRDDPGSRAGVDDLANRRRHRRLHSA
jgi:beta-aspartyl-peptidase (threonine type)